MSTLINTTIVGLEEMQRAALIQLFDGINDALDAQESFMADRDAEFAAALGRDYVALELEHVLPENFYTGHVPSLIKAPIDKYPNVCAMTTQATPAPGTETIDQGEAYRMILYVEVMAKSMVSSSEVNSRVARMAEAANACIMRDSTLGGRIFGFETAPTVLLGDVFARREKTSYGPEWFWQGARMEYTVRKEAGYPSSAGSIFRSGSIPEGLDIDQP